ncbi:MAG TPA: alpha/beta hydrolase [Burkholderiales bacterium]|nr:alpha/beta hydrolase [Burkholderiales bacterium]
MPHFSASDGVRIFYEEAGSGVPIVFAHEFGDNYESWAPQMSHFGRRYRCIAYAARGFPPSDVPEALEQYSVSRLVKDIGELMDHLALDRAHLVGVSMGSVPMLNFALAYPARVRSLVIGSTGAGVTRDPAQHRARLEAVEARARDYEMLGAVEMADRMANLSVRRSFKAKDPYGWAAFRERLKKHSAAGCARTLRGSFLNRPSVYDQAAELRAFRVPTLLMFGDDDHPAIEPTLYMREQMPCAGLTVFPWSGHNLNIEEPAAFNRAVEDFFHAAEQGRWRPAS